MQALSATSCLPRRGLGGCEQDEDCRQDCGLWLVSTQHHNEQRRPDLKVLVKGCCLLLVEFRVLLALLQSLLLAMQSI